MSERHADYYAVWYQGKKEIYCQHCVVNRAGHKRKLDKNEAMTQPIVCMNCNTPMAEEDAA